jgi:putative ABC transport system permease protein
MCYVGFYRWRSLVLIGCISLTAFLPILLGILLWQFDQRIARRAAATPLVVGAKGSGVDLTLHALYFSNPPSEFVPFGECRVLRETTLAQAIPLHACFSARGFPVVGTTLEYFQFRGLQVQSGRLFATLGECVLGSDVGADLGLSVGDKLISDRENLIDIAGLFPLRMRVVGVLPPSGTADDRAVFVDVKTSWLIAGLGHGHEDLANVDDPGKVASREDGHVVALASVLPFLEITADNISGVHFHGDLDTFPLTGIIAIAPDEKAETLLMGRYQRTDAGGQILVPQDVIRELMGLVFQLSQIFNASMLLVGFSTLCLLALVIALSLRLRQGEMQTMFRLGCSRLTIFQLLTSELAFIFLLSGVCVGGLVSIAAYFGGSLLESLIVG